MFRQMPPIVRLDATDALFVEAIHTNMGIGDLMAFHKALKFKICLFV